MQIKAIKILRYGENISNNNKKNLCKRANLNRTSTSPNLNIDQLYRTLKDWFEQLQLKPVFFIKEDNVFDTYAILDPGSQFTFL